MSRKARLSPLLLPALALFFVACEDSSGPSKSIAITPGMLASCPEHPFKPEFQGAAKRTAQGAAGSAADAYPFRFEIYNRSGGLLVEWEGVYDPSTGASSARMLWDMKDSRGKPVPSGYYFVEATMGIGEGREEKRSQCVFVVNDADRDKLK